MQKLFLFFVLTSLLIFTACGGGKSEESNEEENTESKETSENKENEEPKEEEATPLKTRDELREIEKVNVEGIKNAADKAQVYRYESEYNLDEIPKEVFEAKNLQTLEMKNFAGTSISDEIGNLKNLTLLALPGANQLEKLPTSIGNLKNLKTLDLGGCKKLDINQVFEVIQNCENLEVLSLNYGQFEELPTSIGKLKNLTNLRLKSTKLKTLPDEFYTLPNLAVLRFGGNAKESQVDFNDFFTKLKGLPKLRHLDVMYSGLTGLPESLKECKSLEKVQWRENAAGWANADAVKITTQMWNDKFPDFEVTWVARSSPMYDMY